MDVSRMQLAMHQSEDKHVVVVLYGASRETPWDEAILPLLLSSFFLFLLKGGWWCVHECALVHVLPYGSFFECVSETLSLVDSCWWRVHSDDHLGNPPAPRLARVTLTKQLDKLVYMELGACK
jgi:hypothetical protein